MRIEPNLTTTPAPVSTPEGGSKVATKAAVGESGGADALGGFSPTSDLAKLIALASQVPEVRTDLVQDVQDRAAVGELSTRIAATDTAASILDASAGG